MARTYDGAVGADDSGGTREVQARNAVWRPPESRSFEQRRRGTGMSFVEFAKMEFAAAFRRGVRQYVLIGTQPTLCDALEAGEFRDLSRFTVDESPTTAQPATFVPTRFADETLGAALERSPFDNRNPSLFVWLGGVGYRTLDNVVASLAFITSLPRGSGVLFTYAGERTCSAGSLSTVC